MTVPNAAISSLPGSRHDSVQAHRRHASEAFAARGLPTTRDEDWKYTDLSRLEAVLGEGWWEFSGQPEMAAVATETVDRLAIPDLDAYRIVFIDGRFDTGESRFPEGVTVQPLADFLESEPEKVLELLDLDEAAPLYNGFVALNAAMVADGLCVCIKDDVCLGKPLYILHLAGLSNHVAHVRHGIALGSNSEAAVIEHFTGISDSAGLTNTMTNIRLGQGAKLSHYRLQQESENRFHIGRVEVAQNRDSVYASHSIALGAALSRTDIRVNLKGGGAECLLNGLYVTGGRQHADHHTCIDHAVPNCTSREVYKGILDGRSKAVFNGKVVVHENAQQTDAQQSNRNLLLSDKAEVDTKPELEIYADDVKCSHGATIGQLDEDQIFYLRTRGLSEADARNVLTFAFADDVLARMPHVPVRKFLEHIVLGKLPQGAVLEELV